MVVVVEAAWMLRDLPMLWMRWWPREVAVAVAVEALRKMLGTMVATVIGGDASLMTMGGWRAWRSQAAQSHPAAAAAIEWR